MPQTTAPVNEPVNERARSVNKPPVLLFKNLIWGPRAPVANPDEASRAQDKAPDSDAPHRSAGPAPLWQGLLQVNREQARSEDHAKGKPDETQASPSQQQAQGSQAIAQTSTATQLQREQQEQQERQVARALKYLAKRATSRATEKTLQH